MKSIAIFASGAGSNARKIIEHFSHHPKIRVDLVVCNKPQAGVLNIADEHGIPTLILDKEQFFRGNAYVDEFKVDDIDFIVLAGFLWKVPNALIHAYPEKIVNIHPALLPKYGVLMTGFPGIADAEIDAIITYINAEANKKPEGPTTPVGEDQPAEDNSLLFGILAMVLAIVTLILLQINSNLKKLTDEKEGVVRGEPIPFWRNKAYMSTLTILFFIVAGYFFAQGAIGLGRQTNYQPEQPIYYSHKVHAGINQVNCLYCHGSAMEGKHANIPSVNVCMNCHMAINEYKGKVGPLQLALILCTFAVGGSLTGFLGKRIMPLFGIEAPWLYIPVYIILITLIWPLMVLLISIPFGQFRFFAAYLKKNGATNGIDKKSRRRVTANYCLVS